MSIWESLKDDRIIGKLTASTILLGTCYALFFSGNTEILHNGTKDILLVIIGGAVTLLFK